MQTRRPTRTLARWTILIASACLAWLAECAPVRAEDQSAARTAPTALESAPVVTSAANSGSKVISPARIQELIHELGSDDFDVRQRAQRELAKFGPEAFDVLVATAESSDDLEIASRAAYLTKLVRFEVLRSGDSPEIRKLLADYEQSGFEGRLKLIDDLLKLPGDAGLPMACRLVRFDRSAVLAKRAALKIAAKRTTTADLWQKRSKVILDSLGNSIRPAADWLRTAVREHNHPADTVSDWEKITEHEMALVQKSSRDSDEYLVTLLLQHKAELFARLKNDVAALAVMRELAAADRGEEETLVKLIDWLVKNRGWPVIDDLAKRFEPAFKSSSQLLYTLAQARAMAGSDKSAEELAQQAFAMAADDISSHLLSAFWLQQRGQFSWSEREYRQVIKLSPTEPGLKKEKARQVATGIRARTLLAEMLHDLESEAAAAKVLEEMVGLLNNSSFRELFKDLNDDGDNRPGAIRSRYHYFLACSVAATDPAKQKQELFTALTHDDTDADVLIALFRLAKEPGEKSRAVDRIKQAAVKFRELIEKESSSAMWYNQLAWLIGNTIGDGHGDFSEAIELSKRSLEISPDSAGYLDTLAHCYFSAGDLENAVRYQSEAAELDQYSRQIQKALDEFRQALETSKTGQKP